MSLLVESSSSMQPTNILHGMEIPLNRCAPQQSTLQATNMVQYERGLKSFIQRYKNHYSNNTKTVLHLVIETILLAVFLREANSGNRRISGLVSAHCNDV